MTERSNGPLRAQAAALHHGTPTIINRFRRLTLLRTEQSLHGSVRILIQRTFCKPLDRTKRIFGPRTLQNEATANADVVTVTTLQERPLLMHSVDGDATLNLLDSAGRMLWSLNAQGTAVTMHYEAGSLRGRPSFLTEQAAGASTARVRERYSYLSTDSVQGKARNLCGRLVEKCNNAGIDRSLSVALTGQVLASEQRLLKIDIEQPDWRVCSEEDTESPLQTCNQLDATGALVSTTHAAGVSTFETYDISGARQQTRIGYCNPGAVGDVITLHKADYWADSRLQQQRLGNGIVDRYVYDPRTARLRRHLTARPPNHPRGGLVISDLHYDYDPLGNILSLDDRGADPQWHDNLQATGCRLYAYDTLNRLVSATGRERSAVVRNSRGPGVYGAQRAGRVWTPYTEHYTYDDGDNLICIRHTGGAGMRTQALDVALSSNRAMVKTSGVDPEAGFLAGGLQKTLSDGRALHWLPDNQLGAAVLVSRDHAEDDCERYHYGDGGSRTRKRHTVTVAQGRQTTLSTYTRAFEVRQRWLAGNPTLHRHVVITQVAAARLVVDLLNGKADLRFTFNDHLNSSIGETDAVGLVTAREEYSPYGCTVGEDESAVEIDAVMQRALRHAGQERDASGLYHYGWRYYQTGNGRWLSADPGGLVDGLNLFCMVGNSPVSFLDPTGRSRVYSSTLIDKYQSGYPASDAVIARLDTVDANEASMHEEMTMQVFAFRDQVTSNYRSNRDYGFSNVFKPHVWIMHDNHRIPGGKAYGSTVAIAQYKALAREKGFYGVLPRSILRFGVTNHTALKAAAESADDQQLPPDERRRAVVARFLDSEGNGRHTRRILERLGMQATSVTLHEYVQDMQTPIIEIEVEPIKADCETPHIVPQAVTDGWRRELEKAADRQLRQMSRNWVSRKVHALGYHLRDGWRRVAHRFRAA
ncbi:RHS repeat-associated core domain-containing protein [Pseudomonas parafulva]|uniref:RHS repeat-associated core domain-containing protein n=1 Tax=Pseudomonas parafulva TaxID=157782 RepID=A0AAI8K890_9PSED|nr:RHS repeat-associated core domain-containing protein [Pseudomonas parafulva]AXO87115.1 RHS repeat-associated core domain-containing protein [Pseudomonas parafulva]